MFKTTSAVLLGLAGSANAFWRMECPGRLDVARLDPIVNPDDVSAHAHVLHGSSGMFSTPVAPIAPTTSALRSPFPVSQ